MARWRSARLASGTCLPAGMRRTRRTCASAGRKPGISSGCGGCLHPWADGAPKCQGSRGERRRHGTARGLANGVRNPGRPCQAWPPAPLARLHAGQATGKGAGRRAGCGAGLGARLRLRGRRRLRRRRQRRRGPGPALWRSVQGRLERGDRSTGGEWGGVGPGGTAGASSRVPKRGRRMGTRPRVGTGSGAVLRVERALFGGGGQLA